MKIHNNKFQKSNKMKNKKQTNKKTNNIFYENSSSFTEVLKIWNFVKLLNVQILSENLGEEGEILGLKNYFFFLKFLKKFK